VGRKDVKEVVKIWEKEKSVILTMETKLMVAAWDLTYDYPDLTSVVSEIEDGSIVFWNKPERKAAYIVKALPTKNLKLNLLQQMRKITRHIGTGWIISGSRCRISGYRCGITSITGIILQDTGEAFLHLSVS
jgi:hypothetical protein